MKNVAAVEQKIFTRAELLLRVAQLRMPRKTIAFTNGCFDVLHRGHIAALSQAAAEADFLIVAINSDASTRRLKGPGRPVNAESSRALLIASLLIVDAVIIFEEDTPLETINAVRPDVLVKGGDYTLEQIVGAKEVMEYGGRVVINSIVEGFSTTAMLEKITKL